MQKKHGVNGAFQGGLIRVLKVKCLHFVLKNFSRKAAKPAKVNN
ncbi:hypothetical protein D1BOALGB6SA_6387 [Olavius sp. associated proteobacterium Delta 1]|nr:hypothetical protein D1BOALGB6SA_6387 [Olavius sp. associated proteobacterium Delta 1]